MLTKTVNVTQTVRVEIDETKFTDGFMEEFPKVFYPFYDLDDHIKHLAQLEARGMIDFGDPFIEGYGKLSEMGISTEVEYQEEEIIE